MLSALLLAWYDEHKRTLPFRGTHDPYRVWLSEIMLQQTRTETVGVYYARFLERFPDVFALAAAPEQDVLKCWEGLGYYSRARNLHKAAKQIVSQYGGQFPRDVAALRALPGVGDYTAAAVASIAFDAPAPAMDGNLTRVLSRVHGVREDVGIPSVRRRLLALAQGDMPPTRCGDFNQALMDLGASLCAPGTPDCPSCPLRTLCDACRAGDADMLPIRAAAKPPKEVSLAVALVTCHGRLLLTQRKEALLRNLWVFPLIEDAKSPAEVCDGLRNLGVDAVFRQDLGPARHVFTHRVWNMMLYHFEAESANTRDSQFFSQAEMLALPLPTAMRAAKEHALRLLTPEFLPLDEQTMAEAAGVYAESWQAAHKQHSDPDFVSKHTPAYMETLLRRHMDTGRQVDRISLSGQTEGVLAYDTAANELVLLYIHPRAQGAGLGKAAVAFAVSRLDSRREMRVTCLRDNERALRLYASFGFCHEAAVRLLNEKTGLREADLIRPGEDG